MNSLDYRLSAASSAGKSDGRRDLRTVKAEEEEEEGASFLPDTYPTVLGLR